MKRLIILLLLAPVVASAACLPSEFCSVRSGTPFTLTGSDQSLSFNIAGSDFSASAMLTDLCCLLPFREFFEVDSDPWFESFGGSTPFPLAQFALTVNGVPWGIPAGGSAEAVFFADLGVPFPVEASGFSVPFGFQGSFTGAPEPFAPGVGCDVLNCQTLNFRGGGIVTTFLNGGPFQTVVESQTFTFNAPEPSTASLLLIALAGLAVIGRRRGPSTT